MPSKNPQVQWPSPVEVTLLKLLEAGESNGYMLAKNGLKKGVKKGSVYTLLNRMVRKGFLQVREEDTSTRPEDGYIGIARKYHSLTPLGQRALKAWRILAGDEA